MSEDPLEQIRAIFREEGKELIGKLEEGLLKLEQAPPEGREAIVREMMRAAHNLKGAAGTLGLMPTSELSHAIEEVLKAHRAAADSGAFDLLHRGIDELRATLDDTAPGDRTTALVTELKTLAKASPGTGAAPVSLAPAAVAPRPTSPMHPSPEASAAAAQALSEQSVAPAPSGGGGPEASHAGGEKPAGGAEGEDWIRISLGRLNELTRDAGEVALRFQGMKLRTHELREYQRQLVVVSKQVAHELGDQSPTAMQLAGLLRGLSVGLDRFEYDALRDTVLGDALHDSVRALRLRPLSSVFRIIPRMARDLGRTLGKNVSVTISGSQLEVEKSVLELLKESLLHLVRNSMDHGLETPAERTAAGKPPVGRIHISARLQGSWLVLECGDDGRGVDSKRVIRSALNAKVITPEEAETLGEERAQDLIFHSGLSTKEVTTEISGRGVGLDAVRTAVEAQRGSVRVVSKLGQGATFVLQLPLLSHRTHVLILRVGSERVALPSAAVWKVLHLQGREGRDVAGQPAVELDGLLIPLISLGAAVWGGSGGHFASDASVILLRSQGRAVGCVVDEFLSDEEVVVRELEAPLATPAILSGVAVRSTGDIVCIINPVELVKSVGVRAPLAAPAEMPVSQARSRKVLVVDDSFTVRALEKSILEMAGYDVVLANDGEEALEVLGRQAVDVVVSDINMPRRNGFELLAAVRQSPRFRQLAFILVTSRSSEEDRRRGLDLGASAYVVKSEFDREVLLDAVARFAG